MQNLDSLSIGDHLQIKYLEFSMDSAMLFLCQRKKPKFFQKKESKFIFCCQQVNFTFACIFFGIFCLYYFLCQRICFIVEINDCLLIGEVKTKGESKVYRKVIFELKILI